MLGSRVLRLFWVVCLVKTSLGIENAMAPEGKTTVEFLEDTRGQLYLDALSMRDRYYLDLFMLHKTLRSSNFKIESEAQKYCPINMYHNFGLKGFTNPLMRTKDIPDCASMRLNCCTSNDYALLSVFNQRYLQYVAINHDYHAFYIKEILRFHEDYASSALLILGSAQHRSCKLAATSIIETKVTTQTIERVDNYLKKARYFDESLKKGAKCLLCDFDNTKHISGDQKVLLFDKSVCSRIVTGTFDYHMFFRKFVWKYINTVNVLAHCANKDPKTPGVFDGKLKMKEKENIDFLDVEFSLYDDMCSKAVKEGKEDSIFQNCMNYCHKYDLWKFGGVFQDPMKLGRMFTNIKNKLMRGQVREVQEIPEPLQDFWFPFTKAKYDIFTKFNVIYSLDGVQAGHLFQSITE